MSVNWQPSLIGPQLLLRPLTENDFDSLFAAASEPLIWEQHPDQERYTPGRFQIYFRSGIESKGALAILDRKSGRIIGSSRFTEHHPETSSVEIGFTFLARDYWGGPANQELKRLMLDYAFQFVETVYFVVGEKNLRSQKALLKLGVSPVVRGGTVPISRNLDTSLVFQIQKADWLQRKGKLFSSVEPSRP